MSAIEPLVKPLQIAINRYLALDPEAFNALARFEGNVIALSFIPTSLTVYLLIGSGGFDITDQFEGQPDVLIKGSPVALLMTAINADSPTSALDHQVSIEGDTGLGTEFMTFLTQVEVDFEEPLSNITGDVIAHQVGDVVRSGLNWLHTSMQTNALNSAEFLKEEVRFVPSTFRLQRFIDDVDDLRAATDRLEAKVSQLEQRRQKEEAL